MTTAPRLRAVDSPDAPRMSRLSQGANGMMSSVLRAPTTIEVTQDSPTTVPARCGSVSRCSATYFEAVMLSPEVNSVVNRLVVDSTMASSPKCVAPNNLAQTTLAAMASPLANPAPATLQVAPVAIRRRSDGSSQRRYFARPNQCPSGCVSVNALRRAAKVWFVAIWTGSSAPVAPLGLSRVRFAVIFAVFGITAHAVFGIPVVQDGSEQSAAIFGQPL